MTIDVDGDVKNQIKRSTFLVSDEPRPSSTMKNKIEYVDYLSGRFFLFLIHPGFFSDYSNVARAVVVLCGVGTTSHRKSILC